MSTSGARSGLHYGSGESPIQRVILGVAHELNNPNTFIRVNTANLKKMLALINPVLNEHITKNPEAKFGPYTLPELRAKMNQIVESVLDATIRIVSIADKLKQSIGLDLSEVSLLSPASLIENILSMHRFLLERYAKVEFVCGPEVTGKIKGHTLQLEQALANFITNACDAIRDRFGETDDIKGLITITLSQTPEKVRILITDNGCGMDEATRKKIFDPYFTTKPQGTSDGIGLTLTQSIIEKMNGTIQVESTPGEGSRFIIEFPKFDA